MTRRSTSFECQSAKEFWLEEFVTAYQMKKLPRDSTPLRYPGGKGSLKYFLANVVNVNGLRGKSIVEPFCGGAGASIPLLLAGVVNELHLNDANPAIASFWKAVVHDTDALVNLIKYTPVTVDQWRWWKDVLSSPDDASDIELGFAAFFMNRCNRSGLLAGGPIGGLDQSGSYKIDCRFNREALVKRIEAIAAHRDKIFVHNADACDYLKSLDQDVVQNSLIFIDPPYVVQGKNLYKSTVFDEPKHRELSEYIKLKDWRWLITYDDHPLIHQLYAERTRGVFELSYLMQQAKVGRELLVASTHCRVPLPHAPSAGFNELSLEASRGMQDTAEQALASC